MTLNKNEEKILTYLKEDPYLTQKDLAKKMDLSRPAVANLISGLTQKGHILGKPYVLKTQEYITCVGGANIDHTFTLTDTMILKTSNPVNSKNSYGGVIRNIAENLSRLNQDVSLMTLLGQDASGDKLLNDMKKWMKTFATEQLLNETTGSYYSVLKKNGEMEIGFADMGIYDTMNREWVLNHKKDIYQSKWIIADLNMQRDAVEALIEAAKEINKPLVIIGVSGPKMQHMPNYLEGVELIIVNLDESQAYFKTSINDPQKLASMWLQKGIKKIVITQGKEGCVFANQTGTYTQQAVQVNPPNIINVTGAGDAFSAGLIYGITNHKPFSQSVLFGTINAALTIQSPRAVSPNLSIKLIEKEIKNYDNK